MMIEGFTSWYMELSCSIGLQFKKIFEFPKILDFSTLKKTPLLLRKPPWKNGFHNGDFLFIDVSDDRIAY